MAMATEADYKRDPTRWGSADMAANFLGFKHLDMRTSGAVIRLRHPFPEGHPTLHELLQSVKRRQRNYPLAHKINLGSGPLAKLIADETSGQSRQLRQERRTKEEEESWSRFCVADGCLPH